jgi:hypothetical protein
MEQQKEEFVSQGGAGLDDMSMQHAQRQNELYSQQKYTEGARDLQGERSQLTVEGHPEYVNAAQQQHNVSDVEYTEEALKALQKNRMDNESQAITQAQRAQRLRALADEKKQKEKLAQEMKDANFSRMDPENNPIVQDARYKQQLLQQTLYSEEAKMQQEDVFYPQTVSGEYEAGKKVHGATADQFYGADAKAMKPQYNQAQTPGYHDQQKLHGTMKGYDQDYQNTKHQVSNSHPDQPGYRQSQINARNFSDRLYTEGAAAQVHQYTAEVDTPEMRQIAQNNRNYSRKAYREAYRLMIEGHRAQTEIESHPEYVNAANAQKAVSDLRYKAAAMKAQTEDLKGIDDNFEMFSRSKATAAVLNDKKYQQQKTEAVEQCRGFQTMDAATHPLVGQHNYQGALQSNLGYKGEHNKEKQDVFFPQTITDGYEQQKNLKDVNRNYKKDADEERTNVHYNYAETEHAQNQTKLAQTISTYSSNPGAGDYRKALADTPVISTSKKMQEHSDKKYREAGEVIKHQYTLPVDTPEYRQQKLNEYNASKKKYREAYAKMLNDMPPDRSIEGHPEYVLSARSQINASDTHYQKEARHANQRPVGTADLEQPAVKQAVQNQKNVSDRLYTQSGRQVQDDCKGFMTMTEGNPLVAQHQYYAALNSDRGYKGEHQAEKQDVYFPANITPGFEADRAVKDFRSDKFYKKDTEQSHKIDYNAAETEKYQQDAALNSTMYHYDDDFKQSKLEPNHFPAGMLDSALYEAQINVGKNVSDARYSKESKEAMKTNHQDEGALQLKQNAYAQHIQSDNQYQATYNKETKGTRSLLPIEGHPEYVRAAANSKAASDNHYRKGNEEVIHQYVLDPMDIHIDGPRRWNAQMDTRAYEQSRLDAQKKMKYWTTMDGYQHPVTKKAQKDKDLYSQAQYVEDWNDEKTYAQFPVNQSEFYQQNQALQDVIGGNNYHKAAQKAAETPKFIMAETERYADIKKLREVVGGNNYEDDDVRGNPGNPVDVTMEMERLAPLKEITHSNYQRAAKKLAEKYHLAVDDQHIAHQLQVSDIVSDRLYVKGYKDDHR